MKQPYIILVDDDRQVLGSILRDVRQRYRDEYRIAGTDSAREALDLIRELKLKNEALALIISDQRMPEMDGISFLGQARAIFEFTKLVLLTAYSDIDAAIKAINDLKLDHYLLKPWNPPEEKLYPVLDDLLDEWHAHYKPGDDCIRVIGFQWSPRSHQLKDFLSGNLVPYSWLDAEHNEEAKQYILSTNRSPSDLPIVVLKEGKFLCDPALNELGSEIGLQNKPGATMYDLLIIGAGPAGLAASVYGSCEGLKTLLIERSNPGGQASSSARIENYLGFPSGLSGAELTRRGLAQTRRFGTEILTPQEVKKISTVDGYKIVELGDGTVIHSKTVLIATGVAYRKLDIPGIEKFTGAGVYYGSASVEAHACRDADIYLVGGGNSACQAALYLCKFARSVNMLIRTDQLKQVAANYLVENISKVPNIRVWSHTEVVSAEGSQELERITLRNTSSAEEQTLDAKALFIYIGARPGTDWLNELLLMDDKGFIKTGSDLRKEKNYHRFWKLDREPYMPETSIPGIFAGGDVRAGALSGISSAVGEGSMAVRYVRKYLQEM